MVSKHYRNQRNKRENLIEKYLGGDGKVIDSFIVDKGHKNGIERHELTDNGVILIYNANTNILVTKKIARPKQIKEYFKSVGKKIPKEYNRILYLAEWHKSLGYNNI